MSKALIEARKQAKNLVTLAQQAKDAGTIPEEEIKGLSESAQKMDEVLKNADDCVAAREFGKLPALGANASGMAPAPLPADGTCEHSAPPCIYQPYESEASIKGRLSFAGAAKVPPTTTASLSLGGKNIPIDLQSPEKSKYDPDTGIFNLAVSPLNAYKTRLNSHRRTATVSNSQGPPFM